MTENEAIEALKLEGGLEITGRPIRVAQFFEGIDVAIKALEEVQQYRAIGTPEELQEMKKDFAEALSDWRQYRKVGTLEECRAAVEKQTAKRPDYEGDGYADGHLVYDTWICPCCGKHYEVDYDDYDFCPTCGQCIDWSDEE